VTGIVYDAAQRILLVRRRESAVWSTPGGATQSDETPADAIVREVVKETGLAVEPVRILGEFGGRISWSSADSEASRTPIPSEAEHPGRT
jgi:ADP-ribose pyrophosphatase YjhB (NUDIX family)